METIWLIGWLIVIGISIEEIGIWHLPWYVKLLAILVWIAGTFLIWPICLGMTIAEAIRKLK